MNTKTYLNAQFQVEKFKNKKVIALLAGLVEGRTEWVLESRGD